MLKKIKTPLKIILTSSILTLLLALAIFWDYSQPDNTVFSYYDKNTPCSNSDQCLGDCLLIPPNSNPEDPEILGILNKFNCKGLGDPEIWYKPNSSEQRTDHEYVYEKYFCEKTSLAGKCSPWSDEKYGRWELNNNIISFLKVFFAL